jgi:hypothetical protein
MNDYPALRRAMVVIAMALVAGLACGGGAGDSGADAARDAAARVRVGCDVHQSACAATIRDRHVTLDITPKPVTAMEDLTFTVTLVGVPPTDAPSIDLNMTAMDMGPNRVDLKPVEWGVWTGKGVIVRCPSGKRQWVATVMVPGAGKVEFVFDVVY